MLKIQHFIKESDKYILFPSAFSVISSLLITILLVTFYNLLPAKLPLLYSLPWGDQQLVSKQQFLLLPAIIVLISLINVFLSSQLHLAQYVLKRIILLNIIFIDLILVITAVKIIVIFI